MPQIRRICDRGPEVESGMVKDRDRDIPRSTHPLDGLCDLCVELEELFPFFADALDLQGRDPESIKQTMCRLTAELS